MRVSRLMRVLPLLLALGAGNTLAARPGSELDFHQRFNGVPVRVGVITTTGASTTNATTAAPFTITAGSVIEVVCDAAANVNVGATSSTSYTAADFGRPMTVGVSRKFVLRNTDTTIAVAASATVNCNVAVLQ